MVSAPLCEASLKKHKIAEKMDLQRTNMKAKEHRLKEHKVILRNAGGISIRWPPPVHELELNFAIVQ